MSDPVQEFIDRLDRLDRHAGYWEDTPDDRKYDHEMLDLWERMTPEERRRLQREVQE